MIAGTDPRQFCLLFIALVVPAYLILTRRDSLLLAWVCFVVCINVFDTTILINLPAARLAGLLLLPRAIRLLPVAAKSRPGRALTIQYGYLLYLGILFGFLVPWPSGGLLRSFNQIAPGRALIYTIRTAADISLAFFIAGQVVKSKRADQIARYVLVGTSVAAIAGVLEYITRFDLYGLMTGLRPLAIDYRTRGFNFEPRALGLVAVLGMLLSVLMYSRRHSWRFLPLLGLHGLAFFLAGSTSALFVLASAAAGLFAFDRRCRVPMVTIVVFTGLVLAGLVVGQSRHLGAWLENAKLRLSTEAFDRPPKSLIEKIAFRMDVFDGSAVLFLAKKPLFLLSGTGPGLISLPATDYIPSNPYFAWTLKAGLNSTPTTGLLLEISNAGLVGLILWFVICASAVHAFGYLVARPGGESPAWSIGRSAFVIAAACYLAQASVSSVWPVFMGTGIGAACLAGIYRSPSDSRTSCA